MLVCFEFWCLTKNSLFQRNWAFATNSNFLILISWQPDGGNAWYFKLRLFDLTEFIVWNIKRLRNWVAKMKVLENQSMWQRLNSFVTNACNQFICKNNGKCRKLRHDSNSAGVIQSPSSFWQVNPSGRRESTD